MLRRWQKDCVKETLQCFDKKKNVFILAAPGSGKTLTASHIAKCLIDEGRVDYVICFSPSRMVSTSIQRTFEKVLGRPFNGHLGAIGVSKTYHSMSVSHELLDNLSMSRVLVVFDEIHHCAGNGDSPANSWGMKLLATIQHLATYTLSLSGTPWRTDTLPIPLASYLEKDGSITCDFVYGLKEAIQDESCRLPQIVAVDVDKVMVRKDQESHFYDSIESMLESENVNYRMILNHPEVMQFMLGLSIKKLDSIREQSPNAGGLVVASSYVHALKIQAILDGYFGKRSTLVSCRVDDSTELIDAFREGSSEWIISIAMISEGTDIPRLQVCCNLTDVTTELYFRQILGRVLRMTDSYERVGYMYMLAEPSLIEYAERLAEDVPGSYNYIKPEGVLDSISVDVKAPVIEPEPSSRSSRGTDSELGGVSFIDDLPRVPSNVMPIPDIHMDSFKTKIISFYTV
jgi:superfamily II DNA or RNA helicase